MLQEFLEMGEDACSQKHTHTHTHNVTANKTKARKAVETKQFRDNSVLLDVSELYGEMRAVGMTG